jgi:hypothetical protein
MVCSNFDIGLSDIGESGPGGAGVEATAGEGSGSLTQAWSTDVPGGLSVMQRGSERENRDGTGEMRS